MFRQDPWGTGKFEMAQLIEDFGSPRAETDWTSIHHMVLNDTYHEPSVVEDSVLLVSFYSRSPLSEQNDRITVRSTSSTEVLHTAAIDRRDVAMSEKVVPCRHVDSARKKENE